MSLHFINRPWPVEEFISVSFILCEVENRQTNGPSNDPLEGLVAYNTGPRLQVQQSTKVFVWGRETKSTADAEYKDRPVCDWGCIWRILEDWERNKFNIFFHEKETLLQGSFKAQSWWQEDYSVQTKRTEWRAVTWPRNPRSRFPVIKICTAIPLSKFFSCIK